MLAIVLIIKVHFPYTYKVETWENKMKFYYLLCKFLKWK